MNHLRAGRRLSQLMDGELAESVAEDVRSHLRGCRRCRRHLAELQMAETLVARLPLSVAPLEFEASAHMRLSRLALWSDEPALPDPTRWRVPALGLAWLVLAAALVFSAQSWAPLFDPPGTFDLAVVSQETALTPVGWRPGH